MEAGWKASRIDLELSIEAPQSPKWAAANGDSAQIMPCDAGHLTTECILVMMTVATVSQNRTDPIPSSLSEFIQAFGRFPLLSEFSVSSYSS